MLLFKLFVAQFYKSNAGFFLFFFFLFFGTVNGGMLLTYHLSLIESIISSPVIMAGVMVLWGLYDIKCIRFCQAIIHSSEGTFLYNMQVYSAPKQMMLFGVLHLLLYAPVLVYAIVVVVIAMQQQHYAAAAIIMLGQVLFVTTGVLVHCYSINSSWKVKKKLFQYLSVNRKRAKAFIHYLIYHLLHEKWQAVLAIKLFSFLLLYLMLLNGKDTGQDFLILVFLVIMLAHVKLPFQLTGLMEGRLAFHRNLPVSQRYVAAVFLYTYAVLLLPDMVFLLIKSRDIFAFYDIVWLYGFGVITMFLLTAVLYNDAMNMNEYTKVVFGLFFVAVFGLYSRNYALLSGAEAITGALLFWNGYPKYEARDTG